MPVTTPTVMDTSSLDDLEVWALTRKTADLGVSSVEKQGANEASAATSLQWRTVETHGHNPEGARCSQLGSAATTPSSSPPPTPVQTHGVATTDCCQDKAHHPGQFDGSALAPYQSPPPLSSAPRPHHPRPLADDVLLSNSLKMELPTFSGGHDDDLSPAEFLAEFLRFCRFHGIDEHTRMRRYLPCALVEDAHQWWFYNQTCGTWDEFVKAFHAEYSPPDYYIRLRRELDARTQHPREPLGRYIRTIAAFYDRIGDQTVTEEDKIRRVRTQMHPQYRLLIQGRTFASLREMVAAAPGLQEEAWQMFSYKPPPAGNDLIAQDLAYWDNDVKSDSTDWWSLKPAAMHPSRGNVSNALAISKRKKKNKTSTQVMQ